MSSATASRPREQSKQETREALIEAALAEFSERGLDAPSLDAICARAGYTRGAFYVHFADRDELIAAAMERVINAFLDAIIATGDAAVDFERTIRFFSDAVLTGNFLNTVRFHQIMEACGRSALLREKYIALVTHASERVSNAIREGQTAGTVRADVNADMSGKALVALVLGVHLLTEVGYPVDASSGAEVVLQLFKPAG